MRIQTNVTAMNTHRMYTLNNNNTAKSAEKLSSGYRINRAGDDAAGLAISEKMRAQIKGLAMASKNSQDAISLVQTAEGALQEVHTMLQRMNELAVQAATGTNENFDREQIDAEFTQLKNEIDDVSKATNFNNMRLLDGSLAGDAKKVVIDSSSAVQPGKTISTGTGNTANYTITSQTGLSGQSGKYEIADKATDATLASDTEIKITFTDDVSGNKTNTVIDLAKVITGDLKNGGAFKVDLSSAGLGVYEMTGTEGGDNSVKVSAETLAKALTSTSALITSDKAVSTAELGTNDKYDNSAVTADAGTYTFSVDTAGKKIVLKDANGTEVKSPAYADPFTVKDFDFGEYGKFSFQTAPATVTELETAFKDKTITVAGNTNSGGGLTIQVGAEEGNTLQISIMKVDHRTLGLGTTGITDQDAASHAISNTRNAINLISEQRAALGAIQNRLDYKISNLDNTVENLSEAESRIRNIDMAKEMTNYTKNNILSQAATAMLAQANSMPQNVLQLLQQ